jgi:hypothetical protein
MTRTPVPPRGGIAGLWLLFCAVAGGVGLAFDLGLNRASNFWIGAEPGGAAALGLAAAAFVVIAARLARLVLARRPTQHRGGDADHHA